MLHIETFEVVGADETFLDLAIESWEVILPLKSPSSDTKSPLRLDRDGFGREGDSRVFVICSSVSPNGRFVRMS